MPVAGLSVALLLLACGSAQEPGKQRAATPATAESQTEEPDPHLALERMVSHHEELVASLEAHGRDCDAVATTLRRWQDETAAELDRLQATIRQAQLSDEDMAWAMGRILASDQRTFLVAATCRDHVGALAEFERLFGFEPSEMLDRVVHEPGPMLSPAELAELERACEADAWMHCNNLGLRYRRGDGVVADEDTARMYLQRGCDAGDHAACANLRNLGPNGR